MPFTNNYTQDGFNKKNLQTVLHVPFVFSCYLLRENA